MFCENCGEELPAGAQFCVGCGAKVELVEENAAAAQMPAVKVLHACPSCNASVEEGARFCDSCGALLNKESLLEACPNCGAYVAANACFCDECGSQLDGNVSAQSQRQFKVEEKTQTQKSTGTDTKNIAIIAGIVAVVLVVVFVLVFMFVNPLEKKEETQDPASSQQVVEDEKTNDGAEAGKPGESTDTSMKYVASFDEDKDDPFWGVFTYASKSWSEAQNKADALTGDGYDSGVVDTDEWGELNPEQWYVVCTGTWDDKGGAEKMADELKQAGYSDAYAKYTGEYADGDDVVKLVVETAKGDTICNTVNRGSDDYVIVDSSSYTYSESELKDLDLTDAELCIAWNEPFARLGHHFDNPDLQDYFESCSWYYDNHKKYSLSGAAASNNAKLRKIAESNSSSKRWENLAAK